MAIAVAIVVAVAIAIALAVAIAMARAPAKLCGDVREFPMSPTKTKFRKFRPECPYSACKPSVNATSTPAQSLRGPGRAEGQILVVF